MKLIDFKSEKKLKEVRYDSILINYLQNVYVQCALCIVHLHVIIFFMYVYDQQHILSVCIHLISNSSIKKIFEYSPKNG